MITAIVLTVLGIALTLMALVYLFQSRLVFFPTAEIVALPSNDGLEFDECRIPAGDGVVLHGWFLPAADPDAPVVLFCHGNYGNISHRLATARFIHDLGAALLLFDYRGYSRSTGRPSEAGLYADASAAWNYLIDARGYAPERIVILGRSLGCAPAIDLACRERCRGLIVESGFTSAREMARIILPFLPTDLLIRYRFDNLGRIAGIHCPVLVCHSPDDEIVPYEMGERLFQAAPEPKQFFPLTGGHNQREYFDNRLYRQVVAERLGLPIRR